MNNLTNLLIQTLIRRLILDNSPTEYIKKKNMKCDTASVKAKSTSSSTRMRSVNTMMMAMMIATVVKWLKKKDSKRPENTTKN